MGAEGEPVFTFSFSDALFLQPRQSQCPVLGRTPPARDGPQPACGGWPARTQCAQLQGSRVSSRFFQQMGELAER